MFSPRYRILITGECFPQDNAIGLGRQLISIIHTVSNFVPEHLWYGADVDAVGENAMNHTLNNIQLSQIGTDLQFIEYCSKIEQFIWGEFLCVSNSFSTQCFKHIELETEDAPFRQIDCRGILLEIRAFDTAYFEVYTENLELIIKLSKLYNAEIDRPE